MNAIDVYADNGNMTMETGDRLKNGTSSRNLISRGENKKMRIILIFVISILTLSVNGQTTSIKEALSKQEAGIICTGISTTPFVEYVKTENVGQQPAFYINGEFSNSTMIKTVDHTLIDSIHVEKKEIEIGNKKYSGQIFVKMKNEYTPQIISLTGLAMKYANLKNGLTVFMLDNEIIKEDYDQCLVDEKYILKITVDTIELEGGKTNVNMIRLLTKSQENMEKTKEIRIRGLNEMTLN